MAALQLKQIEDHNRFLKELNMVILFRRLKNNEHDTKKI